MTVALLIGSGECVSRCCEGVSGEKMLLIVTLGFWSVQITIWRLLGGVGREEEYFMYSTRIISIDEESSNFTCTVTLVCFFFKVIGCSGLLSMCDQRYEMRVN